jgi:hypothetical protein
LAYSLNLAIPETVSSRILILIAGMLFFQPLIENLTKEVEIHLLFFKNVIQQNGAKYQLEQQESNSEDLSAHLIIFS